MATLNSCNSTLFVYNLNRPGIVGDSTLQENTTMKTRNYTPEMKERAVRMLIEAKDDLRRIGNELSKNSYGQYLLDLVRD